MLVLVATLAVGAVLAGAAVRAHQAAAEGGPATRPAATAPAPSPTVGDRASVTLTAVVPAETFVHLDGHGRPYEAMTNTRVRPAPGDRFFIERNGVVQAAGATTTALVLERAPDSDWSQPGRWRPLD